jgi:cytochrome c biogenesis protein CcdA
MFGLDHAIAELGNGAGVAIALVLAVLLGLRHATDPDHLTAVSTLVLSDDRHGARRATALGLAWGMGHATTMFALGLPVVLAGDLLPRVVQRGAELAIGLVILALAVRLLMRWRRGYFHVHEHEHHGSRHAHLHVHEHGRRESHAENHSHAHKERLGRTPLASFGIGLVHGAGGSAGAGILLLGAISGGVEAVFALTLFALATAISMALASTLFGAALAQRALRRRLETLMPALGTVSLLFGVWYALGALGTVPRGF